jgi:heptosyltransferase-2
MGDVLRTTTILHALPGDVTWVTNRAAIPLLENIPQVRQIVPFDKAERLRGIHFDLAACLEDESEACRLLELISYDRHVGAYLNAGKVVYGESARGWYDMGLISRFGKKRADELKKVNTRSFQECLYEIFGYKFNGQEYVFGYTPLPVNNGRVGIEMRADTRWQWKRWVGYPDLVGKLRSDGIDVFIFEQREHLREFIADVNSCSVVVTGDTLTLHIALALRKRVIAIFGPTSAPEIYDYQRLVKIVSPIECICCYLRTCDKKPNCMDLIHLDHVYSAVQDAVAAKS